MKLGSTHIRGRGRTSAVIATTALLALPIAVEAAHWSHFGGDAGHSGNQPVEATKMPTAFAYSQSDSGPRTSIITSAGATADQVFAYGRQSGAVANVRLRKLEDGAPVGTPADIDGDYGGSSPVDPDADEDLFGPAPQHNVTPVETSGAAGLGQIYAVHNDDNSDAQEDNGCVGPDNDIVSNNDIAIARVDEASGALKEDVAVGGATNGDVDPTCSAPPEVSDGYTIESSAVITPPDSSGTRRLAFIAKKDAGGDARLFVVTIENAGSPDAVMHATTPEIRDIPDANTKASPTLVYLRDADRSTTVAYFAVSVDAKPGAAEIRTFQADNVSDAGEDGPAGPADVTGSPQTISVPVTPAGLMPGQQGSDVQKAPALYVAFVDDGGTANDVSDDLTTVRKYVQEGDNSTLVPAPGSDPKPVQGSAAPALAVNALAVGSADSTDEMPADVVLTTGENLYVLDSETLHVTDRLRDTPGETALEPGVNGFSRTVAATSGDFIFVTTDEGAQLVLNRKDAERVAVADFQENEGNNTSDYATGQPSISHGFVQFLSDVGVFVYKTGITTPPVVIVDPPAPNKPPVAAFAYRPTAPKAGRKVTFDASASSDPDGKVTGYRWDLDGNGSFETNAGGSPIATKVYRQAKTYVVKLRVNDAAGATAEKTVVVKVGPACFPARCATRMSAKVTPRRDTTTPMKFTTRGRITLPTGVSRSAGCKGKVSVQVKVGKKTISTRRAKVASTCQFRSTVKFADRERMGSAKTLRFVVRFAGNSRLKPKTAKVIKVRVA